MVLDIPGGLFGTQRNIGESAREQRAATVIVAVDGSGDTDSIQDGINLLPPGGGVVSIKEGIYTITKKLTIDINSVTLDGAGRGTEIKTTSNITMLEIAAGKSYIHVKNIYFNGAGSGNSSNIGIDLKNCTESLVETCWFKSQGSNAIKLVDAERCTITNSYFSLTVGESIYCDANVITISDNHIADSILSGMIFKGNKNIVSDNTILNCIQHGIYLNGSQENVITSNQLRQNDADETNTYSGLFLDGNADRNAIVGNVLIANFNYGIDISASTCDSNLISGNSIISNITGQVNDQGTNTLPNGATGTANLALDDLNIIIA